MCVDAITLAIGFDFDSGSNRIPSDRDRDCPQIIYSFIGYDIYYNLGKGIGKNLVCVLTAQRTLS